jgi:uncharacterized protein YfiM (DUF2279 family)
VVRPDKLQHFFTSRFVQSAGYRRAARAGAENGPAITGASVVTAIVGVGKEVHDRRTKGSSASATWSWDAAGAGSASLLLARTVK